MRYLVWFGFSLLFSTGLLPLSDAKAAESGCGLVRASSVIMTPDFHGVSVPLSLGERNVTVVVNTAAKISVLDEATVQSLGLPVTDSRTRVMFSGTRKTYLELMNAMEYNWTNRYTIVPNVVLGDWPPAKLDFFVVRNGILSQEYSGVLGWDLLGKFDVEFDFSKSVMNLFS